MNLITKMMRQISRREFLKLSSAAAACLALKGLSFESRAFGSGAGDYRLGRTITSLRYYDKPAKSSKSLGYYVTDTVIKIFETAIGDPLPSHNPLWLRTEDGWLHSSYVQPVLDQENEPVLEVPARGFLAEVSVPFTQSWENNDGLLKRAYRFYFSTTWWVSKTNIDKNGTAWYRVMDDLLGGYYYVKAKHLRPIPPEETTPISPEVIGKRILVNLAEQRLSAYENGRMVFSARISSGTFEGDTPTGEFKVERKQPFRHMAVNEVRGNGFDLPGVPWVSYIAWTGVSLHGTYWHNDYGQPRSHGCINMTPEAAKWIYRWTTPTVPPGEDFVQADHGTQVIVV